MGLKNSKGVAAMYRTIRASFVAFGVMVAVVASGEAQTFDRSKLQIGTYCLQANAQTESHVKDMAACGIDFIIGGVNESAYDYFAKYGVGVVKCGVVPGWWGGNPDSNGHMAKMRPLEQYERALEKPFEHPALVGIDIGDEPSALDFEHIGKVVRCVASRGKGRLVYLNLFPNYAAEASLTKTQAQSQLGTYSYREYLAEYCKHVPLDYICFDSYAWGWGNTPSVLNENLRIVADACTGSGKSLWAVVQANAYQAKDGTLRGPMTENQLRYQANTAMAFGAEVITWACWCKGWWEYNVLDTNGVKTIMYDRLKKVNAEIRRIAPEYMKYRRLTTDFVDMDDGPDGLKNVGQSAVSASNGPVFRDVCTTDRSALVVGHFLSRDGSNGHAIFVSANDDPHDKDGKERVLTFKVGSRECRAVGTNGAVPIEDAGNGTQMVRLRSNQCVLVMTR